ncbi:MAG: sugar ABC transporter ATP-binding protein [Clostridia bacterium]|nr:sugar ABC transporter ATP-binding protein [Clostridia bacterium]
MCKTILEMKNIEKRFSGVYALKGVNFDLRSGEVHALMGENGAGKSTLMKILTGIYKADSGEIFCFGEKREFHTIKDSQEIGISIIHQELNMVKDLTVAQNIFLGREKMISGVVIDDKKMESEAAKLLDYVGIDIKPDVKVGSLTVGKQQMVEITKAVSFDSKILILDEPTAALTETEVEELFRIMNELKEKGIGMIYISHRMDEIERISDRVTVMRDGEYVSTVNTSETTKDDIVKMMVGRAVLGDKKEKSNCSDTAPVVLEVKNLNSGEKIKNVSFSLRKGEILGFSGLMGAGRTEVARAVCGVDRFSSGEIYINGEKTVIKSPADAVEKGICYLSEDRKRYGLLLDKSVADNSVLANLDDYIKFGFINDKKATEAAKEKNDVLKTKTPSMLQKLKNLSGGNQQKVIIARWLLRDSDIFIFDEPTRGIDIGAKSEMYDLIQKLANEGKSIIMISSELSEIQRVSDRVIVMCEGRITGDLPIEEATSENIMKYAMEREAER